MAAAGYGVLTAEQRVFYQMAMLPRAVPPFSHLYWGQSGVHEPTTLPENQGAVINWRKMGAFTAVTTALDEQVNPEPQDISITATTATVEEYGAFVRYTKKLAAMGIDKVAAEASAALGEQAGESLDLMTRNVIVAGTTKQYASTATQRSEVASTMKLTAVEALEAVTTLKVNKARPVESGYFICLIHPHAEYDVYQDTTFQNILYYSKERGEGNAWTSGYIGDALGVRFCTNPNAKVWADAGASSADVYAAMFIGKGAFGIGGLAGYLPKAVKLGKGMEQNETFQKVQPVRLIDKPFGSAGTQDPMDRFATIAWYTTFVTARLQETFMVRLEHGSSLGP